MTHRCPCCGSEVEGVEMPALRGQAAEVLRIIAAGRGRIVSVDSILTQLYQLDDDEPDNARNILYIYVGRIRRQLGADVIENTHGGYRIRMERLP